jgi:hypothetical protein
VRGEQDALDAGPDGAHLVEQGQVFFDGVPGLVMAMAKDCAAHALQSTTGAGRKFDGDTCSGEEISTMA